jgi:hypothetical protein
MGREQKLEWIRRRLEDSSLSEVIIDLIYGILS